MLGGSHRCAFSGTVWIWRGPAPYFFVTVPEDEAEDLKALMRSVTYGWGMIPVRARVGGTTWKTALWPKDGAYIMPLKVSVRKAERIEEGDRVTVELTVEIDPR